VRDVGVRALDVRDGDARRYQTMHNAPCTSAGKQSATLRASAFVQGSLAQPCHRRLIRLSEYRMRQWATAVDQPPFPPVFKNRKHFSWRRGACVRNSFVMHNGIADTVASFGVPDFIFTKQGYTMTWGDGKVMLRTAAVERVVQGYGSQNVSHFHAVLEGPSLAVLLVALLPACFLLHVPRTRHGEREQKMGLFSWQGARRCVSTCSAPA
jgi:hypothetical protein